ncbi:amidohydrolase [Phenylobacterium hankyongense]|uniref:Amidohydrolase n=2 Tax=Phenylobacterium hankyongense TaxID=1813876 RepID=A0A328B079_9CAUL|nr:amidohydrolase [Phenylobacterium hankyongense]
MAKMAFRLACATAALMTCAAAAQAAPIRIHAGELLDGLGGVQRDMTVTVDGSKIVGVAKGGGKADYEFGKLTVMPGLIDTHVHITTHFNAKGRATTQGETRAEEALKWAENVYVTLLAGYTTIQSIGSDDDLPLRAAIADGRLPGPRLLTSGQPISDSSMSPEDMRDFVRQNAAKGVDLIKIFASKSSRDGGGPTLTDAQIGAACGEAKKLGLRTWVHAHASAAVHQAIMAGCYAVTHARFATQADMTLAAERGVYIEPSWGVVQQNYLAHQDNYRGIGNYTQAAFDNMVEYQKTTPPVWQMMFHTKGLKILTGGDTNAGAEGHNANEVIWRVQNGQPAMDAIVSVTSLDATSLRLGDVTGSIKPGMEADIIAVEGDPLKDITSLKRVLFVMKGGKVFKNVTDPSQVPQ